MRWKFIASIIGILLVFLGLSMVFPLLVSFHYHDLAHDNFIRSIGITMVAGLILILVSKKRDSEEYINQKEGMTAVALAWTAIGLFGALPFYFDPEFTNFTDAFFESVSGFTTTGSSVMTDIEGAAKSLLFWRSLIQWLGGMGIIVLSLAILPFLGVGGIQLYKAEVPSPVPDKLTPRLSDSAKILWVVYAGITLTQIIFLLGGGMPLFEATCHALTTLPTGGFSPKNASVAHYNSAFFDYVMVIFMVLAGINFSLHYQMLRGKTLAFWEDTECRFFLGLTLGLTLLVTWDIYGSVYTSVKDAFRFASFQVVSILTTTGFATADYEKFPGLSQVILFVCMFIGASAGSTGGGMKCARILACFKYCYRELFKIIHPRSISHIKINNTVISDEVLRSIMGFLALYIGLFVLSSIALACMGVDMMTAFGAVAACIGNIGPGFGTVGPTENFAHLPVLGKWLLAWCMLLGRLEIYTVIILFVPEFWKK
ncbi:MAG: TrkH family potassium uptake protein [Proteobacteria bacterium]|nr:TrkH family potassium uptake protein [Pseudomonadota bacterium]MBU1586203.1 TrkH family potassium uptake protein [Pseudomonadota bacterium]MBU2454000.1 TrkH family potassium uptake protein [Pseudomonadota bacterium]MBU2628476.1 TrkH family potassium uptake protein [Pseudomonadota bacterium]